MDCKVNVPGIRRFGRVLSWSCTTPPTSTSLVYCSGQTPTDADGNLIKSDSIQDHLRQCLRNLSLVLKESGSSLDSAVKVTIYLTDFERGFPLVNDEYVKHFKGPRMPARTCVGVKALPGGARVEVECIALPGPATQARAKL